MRRSLGEATVYPYLVAQGETHPLELLRSPDTLARGLDMLAAFGGRLAYTSEMRARFQEVLERRFESQTGPDHFLGLANGFGEDAAFYGVRAAAPLPAARESAQAMVDRLLAETVLELEGELFPLSEQMRLYELESWPRHGALNEEPLRHADADASLFRNPDHGWSAIDRPVSTSDKSNTIGTYRDAPFPQMHPGWHTG